MKVVVRQRRSIVQQTILGAVYVIPARRYPFHLIFLPLWLIGWAFGEVSTIRKMVVDGELDVFLTVWLLLWTFGGLAATYSWLWQVVGREIVTVSSTSLSIRRSIFGIGLDREYELQHIRNLRVSVSDSLTRQGQARNDQGIIAFDYGARTRRFAGGVDEVEARQIIVELQAQYPIIGSSAA